MGKLLNKTALITGGNSGMGFATARAFINEGAHVIITGRNRDLLEKAVKEIGGNISYVLSDSAVSHDLERLKYDVEKLTHKIDILFINAGIIKFAPIAELSETDFDSIINTNFKGAVFTIKHLLPLLQSNGSIIINSTVGTTFGIGGTSAYSASKSALEGFAKVLSVELAPKKIRVNVIRPGIIDTPIFDKSLPSHEAIEGAKIQFTNKVLLDRMGLAEDIANTVVFLASSDSSYINSTTITIDGGFNITPF